MPINISHRFYIGNKNLYFLKYKNIRFQYNNSYKNFVIIDEIGPNIGAYYTTHLYISMDQHIKRFICILKHLIITENNGCFKHPNQLENEYFIKITSEKSRIKVNSNNIKYCSLKRR